MEKFLCTFYFSSSQLENLGRWAQHPQTSILSGGKYAIQNLQSPLLLANWSDFLKTIFHPLCNLHRLRAEQWDWDAVFYGGGQEEADLQVGDNQPGHLHPASQVSVRPE